MTQANTNGAESTIQGKIVCGIAGFYYVSVSQQGIYECKAKGIFRRDGKKPLCGDNVAISILSETDKTGNIMEIDSRSNELIRPAIANIDQALLVFSIQSPVPNFNLLDRFLLMMMQKNIPCILCFSKQDLVTQKETDRVYEIYKDARVPILFLSNQAGDQIEKLKDLLRGKTTTIAGPSGVGKSTLINRLQTAVRMETGTISKKIERGKQTTRHTQLIEIEQDTFIADTPGFSSLNLFLCDKEDVKTYYPEFYTYEGTCRFHGCMHMQEPECTVKEAVKNGLISQIRYNNYRRIYQECCDRQTYR